MQVFHGSKKSEDTRIERGISVGEFKYNETAEFLSKYAKCINMDVENKKWQPLGTVSVSERTIKDTKTIKTVGYARDNDLYKSMESV